MPRKKTGKQRKFANIRLFKGDAAIYLIFAIIVLGGVILSGGVLPQVSKYTLDPSTGGSEIDPESLPNDPNRTNLQLQTFKFKQCAEVASIEFLIDNSGSMRFGTKLPDLKNALNTFAEQLSDQSLVAMRTFSESTRLPVPFGFYTDNKNSLRQAIQSLNGDAGTHSRTAFLAAQQDIQSAINNPEYNKYDFNLIFFSDGIPEDQQTANVCPGGMGSEFCTQHPENPSVCRCYAQSQDPTNTSLSGGNIPEQIKNLTSQSGKNVRIFSILLFDPQRDGYFESKFKNLMRNIASEDSYFETTRSEDLDAIFSQVLGRVCEGNT